MINKLDLQKPNKSIKHIMEVSPKHCENCGNKYTEKDFQVMKNTTLNTLLHLKCSRCGSTYVLNVMNPVGGMVGASRMPLNLDLLSPQEVSKFAGQNSIDKNEAIEMYEFTSSELFYEFMQELEQAFEDEGKKFTIAEDKKQISPIL